MSYLVIARKWRPQNFEDIAGQTPITRTLQNAIRANRIAHAYLFTGVRGVGKTTAARILAKALNCETGPTAHPCNRCSHCEEITQGSAIDVLEIDGASNRGIDEVRQIIENVRYQPAKCRFKIYIIDEVHQVTKDAFNALLKTLEEPPPSVKFILATTEPHRLPETILSRCQRYDFRRIPLREIVERLRAIAGKEGLEMTEGALVLLAREADGSMRDAQSLLEQVLACAAPAEAGPQETAVDETFLQEILGLAERRMLYDLSAAVIRGDARKCVELVAAASNQGRDLSRLSRDLVEHFRNLLVAGLSGGREPSSAGPSSQLLDLPDQEISDLSEQVRGLSEDTLLDYFDVMVAGDEEVGRSGAPRFALEAALIRLATLPRSLPVGELVERLERLESKLAGAVMPGGEPASPPERRGSAPRASLTPVAAAESAAAPAGDWAGFVAFVGREQKFLASHLQSANATGLPAGPLRIEVGERHHFGYLQDGENLSLLKDLARRFFSREVAIEIHRGEGDGAPPSDETGASRPASATEERSEMVKEALRIFGGSVRQVRRDNG